MKDQENGQVQEVSETNGYGMVEQSNIDNMFTRLKDNWEPGSKKRVMIVDDDQDMRAIVRTHLTMNGMEVCEAINGILALKTVTRLRPDLVLLDIMMPDIDGVSVCRYIKVNVNIVQPPIVIMMTGLNDRDHIGMDSIKAGADEYLVKPFSGDILVTKVEEALKNRINKPSYR